MSEEELLDNLANLIWTFSKDVDRIDDVKYDNHEIRIEFHDGNTPKRLVINMDNIGLDYSGNFIHKGYNP